VNDNIAYYRYIYHYLSSQYEYIKSLGAGSQTNINAGIVKKIKVPIPPLYVQEEIVRILDKFTTLEAELEAELDCRKRQYEYYRNQLLSFSNDVEWKSLGNVFDFRNGKGHEKEIVPAGEFIVINSKFISSNGLVVKFSNRQLSPVYKGDILMVMSDLPNGKALAKCFLVDKDSTYTLNQRVCGLTIKNSKEMNPKFAFYILSRNKHLLKYNNGVDQTNLRKDDILKISIPIPSLAEQQRIVSILDKFEALTTSISEGLPKEIELRRKQYEYYRNQLLSFA
jgi:type I restriction system specificity protein